MDGFSNANSLSHFMRMALMVSVMYSNLQQQLCEVVCMRVCGVCRSQAWEDSGGGGIKVKSKNANRKMQGLCSSPPDEHPMQAFIQEDTPSNQSVHQ